MLVHLEAYEIGLITWVALLAVWGTQGLISAFLEYTEPIGSGENAASGSWRAFALIAALIALEFFWSMRFLIELFVSTTSASTLARYASLLCFTLAAAFIVYRHAFMADELLSQERDDGIPW